MTGQLKNIFSVILAVTVVSFSLEAYGNLQMDITSNRDSIYIGESLILTIKVSGSSTPPAPDLTAIKDCRVQLLGSRDESHQSISIINGKMTRTGFTGRTFTYNITPEKTGSIQLGPVKLASLAADGPFVRVIGLEEQDDVIITVEASRDTVLVDESFEVNLNIYIKTLTGEYSETERIMPDQPPHVSIPYLQPMRLEGLEHQDSTSIIRNWLASRPGIAGININSYSLQSHPFDFENMFNFNEQHRDRPAVFQLPRSRTVINNTPYWRYHVQTRYVAREERNHTFGPVLFKGPLLDSVTQAGQAVARRIFAAGPSATVRVIPPPEEGRPASFVGAIGTDMKIDASLDTQNCMVGDPLTLTLTVGGNVNLRNIYPPDLTSQTNLSKNFRIYPDTLSVSRQDNSISFSYTLRPLTEGSLELPPVEISYFDSGSRSYLTRRTNPIPITIRKGDVIDSAMILGMSTNMLAGAGSRRSSSMRYYAPLINHPDASQKQSIGLSAVHYIFIAGAPGLFLLSMAVAPLRRIRKIMRGRSHHRHIFRDTLRQLKTAPELPPAEAHSAVAASLRKYISRRFNTGSVSITPADISRLASGAGLDTGSANLAAELYRRNFDASFSNSSAQGFSAAADAEQAAGLIRKIESLKTSTPHTKNLSVIFLAALLPAMAFAGTDISSESGFLWEKAWNTSLHAASPAEFTGAAQAYSVLAASGVRNRHVFYNQGTALLLAGDNPGARTALERAELYGGFDRRIFQNLQLSADDPDQEIHALSWDRLVFFWHYMMPVLWRINTAVAAWAVLFIVLAVHRIAGMRLNRNLIATLTVILTAFATSAITSALQENQARVKDTYILQENVPPGTGGAE